jgi:hypothetical protein
VQTAAKLVGAKTITSNGRRIAYDCAGVTRAVFLAHGIDLYAGEPGEPDANGVRIIHAHIQQQGTFHPGPVAHPGDLVFFNNTWDFNRDGKVNDPLTHVGIVERREPNGTIIFISRVADAIERYHMNLSLPTSTRPQTAESSATIFAENAAIKSKLPRRTVRSVCTQVRANRRAVPGRQNLSSCYMRMDSLTPYSPTTYDAFAPYMLEVSRDSYLSIAR